MSIQKKIPDIEEIPMDFVNSLITDNAYINNNENTEYICLFCGKISKLKECNEVVDNATLLCPLCKVDVMIINTFSKNQLAIWNQKLFGEDTIFNKKNASVIIKQKYLFDKKKTCRVIMYNEHFITTYWVEDLHKR